MVSSIIVPLLAAILVILAGLVAERIWQFRNNNRENTKHHQDNLAIFELKAEIGALSTKIESQSELWQRDIKDLRERITKIEIKLG